ncbi:MAG: RNA polymerase subunit sigma-24, partial [Acidimicrobiales bacterium]
MADRDKPGEALLALYDRALPVVYGYRVDRCGDRAIAEDLASETFLAAGVAGTRPT